MVMTERLVATGRDTLAEAIYAAVDPSVVDSRYVADRLVDSGAVLIVDPADPALVERVAAVLQWSASRSTDARAAIEAVFGDQ
jgi:hypothetical protein